MARFPRIVELVPRDERAYAALPLRANGMSLGVLGISFAERHDFTEADRDFLLALADICAVHLQQWSKLLREPDGTVTTLDEARGAVLGFGAGDRPERMVTFGPGSILVLFTDGLVERRGEIIDTGLARIGAALKTTTPAGPVDLCDALIEQSLPHNGRNDDTAILCAFLA